MNTGKAALLTYAASAAESTRACAMAISAHHQQIGVGPFGAFAGHCPLPRPTFSTRALMPCHATICPAVEAPAEARQR
jgi:hypothetical protein